MFVSIFAQALVFILLLVDAFSHTDFAFASENPFAESHNVNKFLHNMFLFMVGTFEAY